MDTHSSASLRAETPHETETTQFIISDALRARARSDINDSSSREKIEALVEIICGAGDAPAAALFVLMGILQNSTEPDALAHTAKHIAFTHCGERNVYGMVDAQLALVEGELLGEL